MSVKEMLWIYPLFSFQVDILCNDELLGKDHMLKFIVATRWRIDVSFCAVYIIVPDKKEYPRNIFLISS